MITWQADSSLNSAEQAQWVFVVIEFVFLAFAVGIIILAKRLMQRAVRNRNATVDADISAGRIRPVASPWQSRQTRTNTTPPSMTPPRTSVVLSGLGETSGMGVAVGVIAGGLYVIAAIVAGVAFLFGYFSGNDGTSPIFLAFNFGVLVLVLVLSAIMVPISSGAARKYPRLDGTRYSTKSLWGKRKSVDLAAVDDARFLPETKATLPAVDVRAGRGPFVRIYWLDLAASRRANPMRFGLIVACLEAGPHAQELGAVIDVLRQWHRPPNVVFPELSPEASRRAVARNPQLFTAAGS